VQIAEEFAVNIRAMGLCRPGAPQTVAQLNDIMIRGYLLSVDQGSELKRVTLDCWMPEISSDVPPKH
jgi:hypothetical protein